MRGTKASATLVIIIMGVVVLATNVLFDLRRVLDLKIVSGNLLFVKAKLATFDIEQIVQDLGVFQCKYYVYDDQNIVRQDLRKRVKRKQWTWPFRWGTRLKDYAPWEIRYIEALERHKFRTSNASEADFFLIPISFGAFLTTSTRPGKEIQNGLDSLFNNTYFLSYPERHVMTTFMEPLFEREKVSSFQKYSGLTWEYYHKLSRISVVKDNDANLWHNALLTQAAHTAGWTKGQSEGMNFRPMTKHVWSWSLMGAATDVAEQKNTSVYGTLTISEFKRKSYHLFYHSTTGKSLHNSTQYRHALLGTSTLLSLKQPSSIGNGLPYEEWYRQFTDSKFCATIRGDKPYSRSLFRSLAHGCIPVVVSDLLPLFSPIFRSRLDLSHFAVVVKEARFLADPAESINEATDISMEQLTSLIRGVNAVRRMILPDHPRSLFVEAFCSETLASQESRYYILHNISNGNE